MKKVLITGAGSYIGMSFESWAQRNSDELLIDTLDMLNDSWEKYDFSSYDAVFHVAGIAHQKETKHNSTMYYSVNRDLAIKVANKAKNEGVKQFIFLSSMSIYGKNVGVIGKEDAPSPKSNYGKSKWQAEQEISKLANKDFVLAILRPPMVYGKDCKGNYQTLRRFALKSPFFPEYKNQRSMIYIDNLSDFIINIIRNCKSGVFFPQNSEYVCTAEMIKDIADCHKKKIMLLKGLGIFVKLALQLKIGIIEKVFGDLIYRRTSHIDANQLSFFDSISQSELDNIEGDI